MLTRRTWLETILLLIICVLTYQLLLAVPPKRSLDKDLNPSIPHELKQVTFASGQEKSTSLVNDYEEITSMEGWLVDTVIDLSSDELIEKTLKTLMHYEREELLQITDLKLFTKNMLKALTGPENINNEVILDIGFSIGTANQINDPYSNNIFSKPNEVRANFSSKDYSQSHVISRWHNTDTGTIMYFGRQPVMPYVDNTYIWLKKDNWPEGNYQVDVFQENSSLTPLASGKFQIDSRINNNVANNVTARKEAIIKVPNVNKNILKTKGLQ